MEDFKIPENLGRLAVRAGMWGFVRNMSRYLRKFADERRARGVDPSESDPQAFGAPSEEGSEDRSHTVESSRAKKPARLRKLVCTAAAAALLFVLVSRRNTGKYERAEKKRKGKRLSMR
jgi:hypothetical protein